MAHCPKCGRNLTLLDWKPTCPNCGVNLVFFGAEERLQDEADVAEAEHARVQRRIDRLKASFVGSKYSIVRLILSLLPLAALMLPLCSVTFQGPLIAERTSSVNLITLYNLASSLNFDALFTMAGAKSVGTAFTGYAVALIGVLLSAVLVLVSLILLMMASAPRGNRRNLTMNTLTILLAVAAVVGFTVFARQIHAVFPDYVSGSLKIGAFVYLLTLAALLAINIVITVKKPPVKYKQCYVGGIPAEEYEAMVAQGVDKAEIRKMMEEAMVKRYEEKLRAEAEKEAAASDEE
ncbi:MAG: hypothetical protein IK080_10905 [Clostridia bacterium]|nr:hypothetical protein [Clostridia bacterium]